MTGIVGIGAKSDTSLRPLGAVGLQNNRVYYGRVFPELLLCFDSMNVLLDTHGANRAETRKVAIVSRCCEVSNSK